MTLSGKWPVMADLILVAQAYSHRDDWNVPSVYIDTLKELAIDIDMGDNVDALKAHAKHTKLDCPAAGCESLIPHHMKMEAF